MTGDIFYPIFTLTVTVITCFIRKKQNKIVQGFRTHTFTKGSPWIFSFNRFWLRQKPMSPYFFSIIPWQPIWSGLWQLDFLEKFFLPPKLEKCVINGPNLYWICSVLKIDIIWCVSVQVPYFGKIMFLRCRPKYSQPIR